MTRAAKNSPSSAAQADQAAFFFGHATDLEARLYAELATDAEVTLSGTVYGPRCHYARTLPATFPFRDLGPGPSRLAEAVVTDPCFWTPAEPYYYTVKLRVERSGAERDEIERPFGFRPLAVQGRNFIFKSKRWVLRGVQVDAATDDTLANAHDAATALLVSQPSDELCREASLTGVLLVAQLAATDDVDAELARLARWPAVGIAVLPAKAKPAAPPRNLLLAQQFSAGDEVQPAAWAQAALVEVNTIGQFAAQVTPYPLPVVALRASDQALPLVERRALCDALQRDLAASRDCAGYVV